MEDNKLSKDYKAAFNHADLICKYMPQELKNLSGYTSQSQDYIKGFEARVAMYTREKEIVKDFSVQDLKQSYAKTTKQKNEPRRTKGKP